MCTQVVHRFIVWPSLDAITGLMLSSGCNISCLDICLSRVLSDRLLSCGIAGDDDDDVDDDDDNEDDEDNDDDDDAGGGDDDDNDGVDDDDDNDCDDDRGGDDDDDDDGDDDGDFSKIKLQPCRLHTQKLALATHSELGISGYAPQMMPMRFATSSAS